MTFRATYPRARAPHQLDGVTVHEVADRSRDAFLAFFAGVARRWTRTELLQWLAGPYSHAVVSASGAPIRQRKVLLSAPRHREDAMSESDLIETELARTRDYLHATILSLGQAGVRSEIARRAIDDGYIFMAADKFGALGYVPADQDELSLALRVEALVAADFLTRPRDYDDVTSCAECGELFFQWLPLHEASCSVAKIESAVVPRHAGSPQPVRKRAR